MKFKLSDFIGCIDVYCVLERAQSAFDKWLSEQRVVHGNGSKELWSFSPNNLVRSTAQARLVCIEEIKKCAHEAGDYFVSTQRWVCKHCGKEIEPATWREK